MLHSKLNCRVSSVGDVRNIGLFGAIELVKNRQTREGLVPWNTTGPMNAAVQKCFLENGAYVYTRWNYVFVVPPLISPEAQLADAAVVLDKALSVADTFAEAL